MFIVDRIYVYMDKKAVYVMVMPFFRVLTFARQIKSG